MDSCPNCSPSADSRLLNYLLNEDKSNIKYYYNNRNLSDVDMRAIATLYPYLSEDMKEFVLEHFGIYLGDLLESINLI